MYTQCPQCDAAFRITVDVLQQARGQVRCGNCDAAFNALDHLTEAAPVVAGPEPEGADDLERSQLLETLDRLAGTEEVRIEDTGVEWLVVDDGEEDAEADANEPADDATEATSTSMRWVIEDATDTAAETADDETPDDETTDDTATSQIASEAEIPEEPRYDDNTELPDDFEEQHQYSAPVDPPQRRATDQLEFVVENDDAQADLELSEPDDWSDLLDDIHGEAAGGTEPGDDHVDAEEQDAGDVAENDPQPEALETDEPGDTDDAASVAASMGPAPSEEQEIAMVASQLDDLLETMGSAQEPALDLEALRAAEATDDAETPTDADPVEVAGDLTTEDFDGHDEPGPDTDEARPGDELGAAVGEEESVSDEALEASSEHRDEELVVEATSEPDDDELEGIVAEAAEEDDSFDDAPSAETVDSSVFAAAADTLDNADLEDYADDSGSAAAAEESGGEDQTDWQAEIAEARDDTGGDAEDAFSEPRDAVDEGSAETVAQELASMTGNMAIDADFVRALEDGNFDGTMVGEDGSPVVETIVMEGESVSGALTSTTSGRIRESLKDPGSLLDTYISMRKDDEKPAWPARRFGVAALLALFALLIGQIVHHSRDSLATNGAFQRLLGPVYEFMGSPLVPNWDIRGWQFEATNGGTDEDNSVLTIYSRLSNRAESALPYPLVHVSLTDRYEEIIGSRMLEPSDYLAGNADPERLVAAGADFTAVITIAEPSAEATGFKLNVCYPAGGGDVRCAIEDFKTP